MAKEGGGTAILSVGLSPGVTNLLVRYMQDQFESLQNVDIHIFLGLGEAHGSAAANWTLNNLNIRYTVQDNGKSRQVRSFADKKIVHFPGGLGKRKVYRFNFADQHAVARTFNLPSVSTWVTFDPAAITMLMAFMRQTGLSKLLQYQWVTDVIVKLSTAVQFGSDRFAGQVVARGQLDGRTQTKTVTITGKGQGRATGLVAAQVVRLLYTSRFPSGVFHSEQLFEPMPFIQQLVEGNRNIILHDS